MATKSLDSIIKYFDDNTLKVVIPPETHYDLDSSNKLLESLLNDLPSTEEKFGPLKDRFEVLEKYEVSVPEEVITAYFLNSNLDIEEKYFLLFKLI